MPLTRVTFSSNQLTIRDNLARAQRQYQEVQAPATTGLRINKLSDDAAVLPQIFSYRSQSLDIQQYKNNVVDVKTSLDYADSKLQQASDVLNRIRQIALIASDASASDAFLTQMSTQLDDLKTEYLSYANAKSGDNYIFSGTATSTQPFTGTPVTFAANGNSLMSQVTKAIQMQRNINGNEIFTGSIATASGTNLATSLKNSNSVSLDIDAGDTITIAGSVGATAFSTTLAVSSTTTLTNIAAAMQVALRAAGNNTEVAAVQGDGSIRVTSGAGAITNLQLSISGKTDFNTAFTYAASIAGGGATGSSDTLKTGTGEDTFDVLDDLKTALLARNTTDIATHLNRLDTAMTQVLNGNAQIGLRTQQLEAIESGLDHESVQILQNLSNVQDADISDAYGKLVQRETALRLVFSSTARIYAALSNLSLS